MQFAPNDMKAMQNEYLAAKLFLQHRFLAEAYKCIGDTSIFMLTCRVLFPTLHSLLVAAARFVTSTAILFLFDTYMFLINS